MCVRDTCPLERFQSGGSQMWEQGVHHVSYLNTILDSILTQLVFYPGLVPQLPLEPSFPRWHSSSQDGSWGPYGFERNISEFLVHLYRL